MKTHFLSQAFVLTIFIVQAIFSDDSDDDEENNNPKQVEDPEKKTAAASTTLNRLIAGDFLESLGKELGLEVPPDLPYSDNKDKGKSTLKETKISGKEEKETLRVGNVRSATDYAVSGNSMAPEMAETTQFREHFMQGDGRVKEPMEITLALNEKNATGTSDRNGKKGKYEEVAGEDKKRHQSWSTDSSQDEKRRKHSRHRHRSTSSDDDDSSDDYRDRHHSRSKEKRKRSSREKSSSRRRSKHHKHRDRESPGRHSRHGSSRREHRETKDRRKYKD